ncbi:MAG: thioesterase [Bacteroidetes bacterium]|jgi:acyl-CoA thioesterase FadM|nr:thioesterase [Bacteroidota bacterium]
MARIRIKLPEKFIYSTEMPIRITDVNYANHLGNDAVLGLVHEARLRFLNSLGYSEKNVEGSGLIMIDSGIIYKNQGFQGDLLTIKMGINDWNKIGFDLVYLLTNQATQKDIAWVKTGMAFFDYQKQRLNLVPETFRQKFSEKIR